MTGRYSEYNGVWLESKEARALEDLTTLLDTSIPDISDNSLGSFGFIHENYHVLELRLFQSYFNPEVQIRELPESIGHLDWMHSLDLSHNLLSSLPDAITELDELENCYLDYNNFLAFPEQLVELENLRQLNFDENLLSSIPKSIDQVTYLQSLHLAGNLLTAFPSELVSLKFLRRLDLTRNRIPNLNYQIFDDISQLYVLDLRGNLISETEVKKAMAYLKLLGIKRRKYRIIGQLSPYEDPYSMRNLRKRISSDPHIQTPESQEELEKLASVLKISHEQKYGQTDGILN